MLFELGVGIAIGVIGTLFCTAMYHVKQETDAEIEKMREHLKDIELSVKIRHEIIEYMKTIEKQKEHP